MRKKYSFFISLCRLFFIHLCGIIAVALSYYYGAEFVLSIGYLIIIAGEISNSLNKGLELTALFYILWQGIALLCSALLITNLSAYVFNDNVIFILLFWSTPIYPWASLFNWSGEYYAFSYYALIFWPWIGFILVMGWSCLRRRRSNNQIIPYQRFRNGI